ncbi:uncharacterized protein LOC134800150 [Cydia splendana]|uniref:uncharacterized protein LOC134800150 n=1 Tax=Cydia splendana TaxID=1100963 RepID=UPI0021457F5C
MSSKVWIRFEKQKRDGTLMRLRIQDLPLDRIEEATELMVRYFARDEPYRKATGFPNNPEALEEYRDYINKIFRDPASRNVMCCADTDEDEPDIIGISSVAVATESYWDMTAGKGTEEAKKINAIFYDVSHSFDLLKEFNLSSYYSGKSLVVVPEYRGYGIAEKFLTVRRLMCGAHGIPMTAAWMSTFATQIAAEKGGWQTLCELDYADIAMRHGVSFEGVPPTNKYMAAWPLYESNSLDK